MLLSILVALLVSGLLTAYVNSQRGYSGLAGFIVGFVLGPVGLVLALLSSPNQVTLSRRGESLEAGRVARGELKKCPYCSEAIRPEARVCRHCGREVQRGAPKTVERAAGRHHAPVVARGGSGVDGDELALAAVGAKRVSRRFGHLDDDADGASGDWQPSGEAALDALRDALTLLAALVERLHSENGAGISGRDGQGQVGSSAKSLQRGDTDDWRMDSPLDKARLFWLIENGETPEVAAGINLQRNEKCHFAGHADWYELIRVGSGSARHSGDVAVSPGHGPYWPEAVVAAQKPALEAPAYLDSGRVFVTNKRLIFLGTRRNSTIALSKILDFTAYKKGVEVQKESGRNFFLSFPDGVDVFAMVLGRVMQDAG